METLKLFHSEPPYLEFKISKNDLIELGYVLSQTIKNCDDPQDAKRAEYIRDFFQYLVRKAK